MDNTMDYQDPAADALASGLGIGVILLYLAIAILPVISLWKIFTKAGKPGWASIIPIYNLLVLVDICKKPIWWGILLLVPCVNIVFAIMLYVELAKVFGQSIGFAIGLVLMPIVFIPILAFGSATYVGNGGLSPERA